MPQKCTTAFFILFLAFAAYGQAPVLTDSRDSKTYKWAKIGTQTWMAENLNYKAEGSLCYGENGKERVNSYISPKLTNRYPIYKTLSGAEIQTNCKKYGRLYDWKTALNACPKGWHLPSDAEWKTLVDFAGGKVAGAKLKAKSGWGGWFYNGTDIYEFSALPGGFSDSDDGEFYGVGKYGSWWSATEDNASRAYHQIMRYTDVFVIRFDVRKTGLYSVRCVQD